MFLSMPKKPTPSEGNIPHEPAMVLFRLLRSRHMQNVFGTRRFSGLIFDSPDYIQIHGQEILCDPRFLDGDRPKIITIMWSIWHSRNKLRHEEEGSDPTNCMRMIREALALLELPRKQALVMLGPGAWVKIA